MTLDGARTHALHTPLQPFAFAGEAKVEIALAGGPTRDFNLMLRRARARGHIAVCRTPGPHHPAPDLALVYCAEGSLSTAGQTLHAGDAWITAAASTPLVLAAGAAALLVHVERLDDASTS
jgi:environmental stress-induced protein Ves